ncbi:MAG TPA: LPS export ABC transporter ATP-binding protein [Deltaproteobacteria bacterium]|nr:LPS export ABC transporter ATP-binding protein [Deltaproteobacteria bacterium]
MKCLGARNLVKSFKGRRVINEVSLEVRDKQVVGLLGPNGAGKTTTFYMIVGLVRPDSGSVYLNDVDITDIPMYERARKGIGYLAQEPSVFRKLTVRENIRAVLEFQEITDKERDRKVDRLMEELGISHLADMRAYTLSGGERRRVEIARCLALDPSFLLLDEPFSGIDPIAVDGLQDIVTGLRKKGMGILITDHNVEATLRICDKAYIIDRGSILEEGAPEEILSNQRVREVYLGERFTL